MRAVGRQDHLEREEWEIQFRSLAVGKAIWEALPTASFATSFRNVVLHPHNSKLPGSLLFSLTICSGTPTSLFSEDAKTGSHATSTGL